VDKVSDATAALGRTVAPHIRRHSTKLLPASFTQPTGSGGSSKFDDACDIAASGLKGLLSLMYIVKTILLLTNLTYASGTWATDHLSSVFILCCHLHLLNCCI